MLLQALYCLGQMTGADFASSCLRQIALAGDSGRCRLLVHWVSQPAGSGQYTDKQGGCVLQDLVLVPMHRRVHASAPCSADNQATGRNKRQQQQIWQAVDVAKISCYPC